VTTLAQRLERLEAARKAAQVPIITGLVVVPHGAPMPADARQLPGGLFWLIPSPKEPHKCASTAAAAGLTRT
jgi:hypothetical protein